MDYILQQTTSLYNTVQFYCWNVQCRCRCEWCTVVWIRYVVRAETRRKQQQQQQQDPSINVDSNKQQQTTTTITALFNVGEQRTNGVQYSIVNNTHTHTFHPIGTLTTTTLICFILPQQVLYRGREWIRHTENDAMTHLHHSNERSKLIDVRVHILWHTYTDTHCDGSRQNA